MKERKAFIILFFIIILLPTIGLFFIKNDNNSLLRNLSVPGIKNKCTRFENYYKSQFAFRDVLRVLYIGYKYNVMRENPFPRKSIIGSDGWFFLGSDFSDEVTRNLGVVDYSSNDVSFAMANILRLKGKCDSLEIPFYVIIAPDKASVYNENLQLTPNRHFREGHNLIHEEMAKSGITYFYVDDYLRNCRKNTNRLLYFKQDSHWNYYGAILAIQPLFKQLEKDLSYQFYTLQDYETIEKISEMKDLLDLLEGIKTEIEMYETFSLRRGFLYKKNVIDTRDEFGVHSKTYSPNAKNDSKILLFTDSFYNLMSPFITDNFKEVVYNRSLKPSKKFIYKEESLEEEKPDVVIFELVERNFFLSF